MARLDDSEIGSVHKLYEMRDNFMLFIEHRFQADIDSYYDGDIERHLVTIRKHDDEALFCFYVGGSNPDVATMTINAAAEVIDQALFDNAEEARMYAYCLAETHHLKAG